MKHLYPEMHKLEKLIDERLKKKDQCEHKKKASDCPKCKKEELSKEFEKGMNKINGKD